jgi:hypothetical protein
VARLVYSRALASVCTVVSLILLPTHAWSVTLTDPGQLVLRNGSWNTVQVEVRLGTAASCDLNDSAGIRTLKQGQTWEVVVEGTVCWRRELNPGSGDGQWTSWQSRQVGARSADVVGL